jgi:hypothetical protein
MIADVPATLKHFSAQVAMASQLSIAFSHGLAIGGQQSRMSSVTGAGSGDLTLTAASLATGRTATETATRKARMGRAKFMDQLSPQKIAGFVIRRSNDEFASCFARVSEVGSANLSHDCATAPAVPT